MRYAVIITLPLLLASQAAVAEPEPLRPLDPVVLDEWKVPFPGRARDPFVVDADEVWFVGQSTHYLARLTPSTGEFFRHELGDESGPHNLIVASDGGVWYAGNLAGYIGRYDPASGAVEKIPMPTAAARDPHTLVFDAREEHIWFTVQHGNFVGRLGLEGRDVELVAVPTPRARPYGIRIAADGTPWIVLLGTNKLASVEPATLRLTEHEIPAPDARPRRLEITADGRIWYSDYARGVLGVYDPADDSFGEFALPSGARSKPYGTAADRHGRVWVVETGVLPNLFVGFDTTAEQVVSVTPIPSQGGTVRHMDYHRPTDTVWFGTDTQTIGRASVAPDATRGASEQ